MAKCQRCGYCCTHFMLPITFGEGLSEQDIKDKIEWILVHGPKGMFEVKETPEGFVVKVNVKCRYLGVRNMCLINEHKPKACKEFFCDKARGEDNVPVNHNDKDQ